MPSMPKWLNDSVENIFSNYIRETTITEIQNISESLKRIKFSSNLLGLEYKAGYSIEFRVNDTDYRRYTPYNFDRANNTFEILFHVHGNAGGCNFVQNLSVGDCVKYIIPRGKDLFKNDFEHHIVIGDETALGAALSIKDEVEGYGQYSFDSIFELDNHQILKDLELYGYYTLKDEPEKIIESIDFLIKEKVIQLEKSAFYIFGNGKTLQTVRKSLKQKKISSHQIFAQAYWIEGKKGL
jgi:NADPH-dependent ferric siderophore reductase